MPKQITLQVIEGRTMAESMKFYKKTSLTDIESCTSSSRCSICNSVIYIGAHLDTRKKIIVSCPSCSALNLWLTPLTIRDTEEV